MDGREGVPPAVFEADASFDDLIELVNIGAAMRVDYEDSRLVYDVQQSGLLFGFSARF